MASVTGVVQILECPPRPAPCTVTIDNAGTPVPIVTNDLRLLSILLTAAVAGTKVTVNYTPGVPNRPQAPNVFIDVKFVV